MLHKAAKLPVPSTASAESSPRPAVDTSLGSSTGELKQKRDYEPVAVVKNVVARPKRM